MPESCVKIAQELAEAATRLTDAGLMRGWSGQLSARCVQSSGYCIVLKRSGGSADDPAAYCNVDCKGQPLDPSVSRPSIVTRVHCAIYAACPNVHSVVQCRGLYADAVAVVLGEIPLSLESYWALKKVPKVLDVNALQSETIDQYVDKMAAEVSRALACSENGTTAVCIPYYGMWVASASVAETVGRAVALEDISKAAYLRLSLASNLGRTEPTFPNWFRDILQKLPRPSTS